MIDIQIGSKYKVDAANATGWYEVVHIEESDGVITQVTCKGKEPFTRVFKPEQLVKQEAVRKSRVTGTQLEQVGELKGLPVHNFKVDTWPQEKKRGRPRKNV